jgi:hypothetical protein
MAKLSTGQTYGETGRATSQRLLGGAEQMATGGALAQQSLSVPTLQPQAAPVSTFQQVGAPTLGGPVRTFAPPELPAASQDMAKLAAALGQFNPVLQQLGSSYLQQQKDLDEQRQQEAKQFIADYESGFGPSRGLMDTKRMLERAVANGDARAGRLLTYMTSRHPGMLGYVNEASQDAAVMNNAADLARRIADRRTYTYADGREVATASLEPDSPEYRGLVESLLMPEGGVSARVYSKHAALMASARNAALVQHEKENINYKVERYVAASSQAIDAAAAGKMSGTMSDSDVARYLQTALDSAYERGLPTEQANKLRDGLLDRYSDSVAAWAKQNPGSPVNVTDALWPLRQLMTGPAKERVTTDGKTNESLRLINVLGGEGNYDRLEGKLQTAVLQADAQQRQADEVAGRVGGQALAMQYMPDSAANDPTAIRDGATAARQQILQTVKDPEQQAAQLAQVKAREDQLTAAYTEPQQRNREMWYATQYQRAVQDPQARQQLQAQLNQDIQSGAVSDSFFKSQSVTLANLDNKTVEGYRDAWQAQIKQRLDEWKKISGSPDSYGGQQITGFELNALVNAEQQMDAVGRNAAAQALKDGKDPIKAIEEAFKGRNFGLRERPRGPQQQAYKSLDELVKGSTGWASRDNIAPDKATQLKAQARTRPLFDRDTLLREVSAMADGGQPSPQMRTLLRALTTGPNRLQTSEALIMQIKQHGLIEDIDPTLLQRIKALDNSLKLSSAQPRQQQGGGNPVLAAMGSLLTPSAAAATRPPARAAVTPQQRVDGYMKRLSYLETRIRNIPNSEGSEGRGYFQAFNAFNAEATAAAGGISPRSSNYGEAARASWAWIQRYNKRAADAIRRGDYNTADRLLRNTWPSLPTGSQAQSDKVQREARRYLR